MTPIELHALRSGIEALSQQCGDVVGMAAFQDLALRAVYELAALRDVAEAAEGMPEPLFSDIEASNICTYCSDLDSRHAPDCPWLLLQAALQRVAEVRG